MISHYTLQHIEINAFSWYNYMYLQGGVGEQTVTTAILSGSFP